MSEVIGIVSGKGGVGKTTCLCCLGVALAELGQKVALVDLNTGHGDLEFLFGMEANALYNISHIYSGMCRIEQVLLRDRRFGQLAVLPAGSGGREISPDPDILGELCGVLRKKYDTVLLDCPAGTGESFKAAALWTDRLFLVTDPSLLSVKACLYLTSFLESAGIEEGELLVNRVLPDREKSGGRLAADTISSILKLPLLGAIPEDDSILTAQYKGMPGAVDVHTPAGDAFCRLGMRLTGQTPSGEKNGSIKLSASRQLPRRRGESAAVMGANRLKWMTALLNV